MDDALVLRCGNSQIFPPAFPHSKFILSRKFAKPHDLIYFRLKNSTFTCTTPLISSLSNCCSATLTVSHPQGISTGRLLISATTLAHHGRFSSTPSSSWSSDNDRDHDHQDDYEGNNGKIAKTSGFRAGVGVSLALSCVLGILCCGSMILFMSPSKAIAGFFSRSRTITYSNDDTDNDIVLDSMISPLNGTETMKAFLDGILYLTSPKGTTMSEVPSFYGEGIPHIKVSIRSLSLKICLVSSLNRNHHRVIRINICPLYYCHPYMHTLFSSHIHAFGVNYSFFKLI